MSRAKLARNRAARRMRGRGLSQRALARRLGLSRRTVRGLIGRGGDPAFCQHIAAESLGQLERRLARIDERLAVLLAQRDAVEEEIDVRREDRLLGLTG